MRLETLHHICPHKHSGITTSSQTQFNNGSIYEIIDDIAPSMDDVLNFCEWRGMTKSCSDVFSKIFTENGLCYQFNGLNSREIYTEK